MYDFIENRTFAKLALSIDISKVTGDMACDLLYLHGLNVMFLWYNRKNNTLEWKGKVYGCRAN